MGIINKFRGTTLLSALMLAGHTDKIATIPQSIIVNTRYSPEALARPESKPKLDDALALGKILSAKNILNPDKWWLIEQYLNYRIKVDEGTISSKSKFQTGEAIKAVQHARHSTEQWYRDDTIQPEEFYALHGKSLDLYFDQAAKLQQTPSVQFIISAIKEELSNAIPGLSIDTTANHVEFITHDTNHSTTESQLDPNLAKIYQAKFDNLIRMQLLENYIQHLRSNTSNKPYQLDTAIALLETIHSKIQEQQILTKDQRVTVLKEVFKNLIEENINKKDWQFTELNSQAINLIVQAIKSLESKVKQSELECTNATINYRQEESNLRQYEKAWKLALQAHKQAEQDLALLTASTEASMGESQQNLKRLEEELQIAKQNYENALPNENQAEKALRRAEVISSEKALALYESLTHFAKYIEKYSSDVELRILERSLANERETGEPNIIRAGLSYDGR